MIPTILFAAGVAFALLWCWEVWNSLRERKQINKRLEEVIAQTNDERWD
jgi:uncharacterized membrane protein SpoIIM required for sporulation